MSEDKASHKNDGEVTGTTVEKATKQVRFGLFVYILCDNFSLLGFSLDTFLPTR
jgi:hypothetical protein